MRLIFGRNSITLNKDTVKKHKVNPEWINNGNVGDLDVSSGGVLKMMSLRLFI